MNNITVKQLLEALKDVPENLEVRLTSDSGVDQGYGEVIIEDAFRVHYKLPNGQKFEDGTDTVDYFSIYANDIGE